MSQTCQLRKSPALRKSRLLVELVSVRKKKEGLWPLLRESMWFLHAIVSRTRQQRRHLGSSRAF